MPYQALVAFGANTTTPTIFVMEEETLAAVSSHCWTVLARESQLLEAAPSRSPKHPAENLKTEPPLDETP